MKLKYKGKTVLYKNVAKKISKPLGTAAKVAGIGLALSTVGLPAVAGALAADYAMKYVDKKAGQKLGKYKAYRIARGIGGLATDVYKGNAIAGIGDAATLYEELDPNKKRVAKFDKVNTNYIAPTLQLAGTAKQVQGVQKQYNKYQSNQARYAGYSQLK